MNLIILNITPYKEKDAIITGLKEDEIVSFTAKGIFDPKAKNAILTNPLIEVNVSFLEAKTKYPNVRLTSLLFSPYTLNDSLEKMAAISIVKEAINKMLLDEEKPLLYKDTKECLFALKKGEIHPYQIVISYLVRILKVAGSYFELNSCIFCGSKKDIVSFSFEDGGLICKSCLQEATPRRFNVSQLMLIREIFSSKSFEVEAPHFNEEDAYIILESLIYYIEDAIGVKINSWDLLKN